MALYRITETLNGKEISNVTRRSRPAAHFRAYRLWYDLLGVTAGRDTQWGWNGVKCLESWLNRASFLKLGQTGIATVDWPHMDRCELSRDRSVIKVERVS